MILALPRSSQVSVTAREAVCRFADQLGARRRADACLLVRELVTNAYRHGLNIVAQSPITGGTDAPAQRVV